MLPSDYKMAGTRNSEVGAILMTSLTPGWSYWAQRWK